MAVLDSEWERTISRNDFSLMKEHFEGVRERESAVLDIKLWQTRETENECTVKVMPNCLIKLIIFVALEKPGQSTI